MVILGPLLLVLSVIIEIELVLTALELGTQGPGMDQAYAGR